MSESNAQSAADQETILKLQEFIKKMGSVEKAKEALKALSELRKAS